MAYTDLLSGIFDRNELKNMEAKEQYLSEMRDIASDFWSKYQTQEIIVDYTDTKNQEVYLLRYFPFYTQPVRFVLDELKGDDVCLPEVELLEACFLGCGPGPEVIGLMWHLLSSEAVTTMLAAKMVDIAAETWGYSREIIREFVAEHYWQPGLVEYESFAGSYLDNRDLKKIDVEGSHLAVVQFCLNEISRDAQSEVEDNILELFSRLSPGAIAIVIERDRYPQTRQMLKNMYQKADGIECLKPITAAEPTSDVVDNRTMLDGVPSIIKDNLFWDGRGSVPGWAKDRDEVFDKGLMFAKDIKFIWVAFQIGL